jgi:sirohydrochlorin ferrochelatase
MNRTEGGTGNDIARNTGIGSVDSPAHSRTLDGKSLDPELDARYSVIETDSHQTITSIHSSYIPMSRRTLIVAAVLVVTGCASARREVLDAGPTREGSSVGLLVMAHGGSTAWNETVAAVVAPLRDELPTAVAFGMADPRTLEVGLDSLRSTGVTHAAVVRMFMSGQSFLEQTEFLLGLSEDGLAPDIYGEWDSGDSTEVGAISHGLIVATHEAGLMDSREAREVLTDRARSHSQRPENESVLLIAHGMGDDGQNELVVQAMEAVSVSIGNVGFESVNGATLREDWPEKRAAAEKKIRDYVGSESEAGRKVIVVPMRLSGFGPYAEVLVGLEYTPTEGLLPHPAISEWIRNTASSVICRAGWDSPLEDCG